MCGLARIAGVAIGKTDATVARDIAYADTATAKPRSENGLKGNSPSRQIRLKIIYGDGPYC